MMATCTYYEDSIRKQQGVWHVTCLVEAAFYRMVLMTVIQRFVMMMVMAMLLLMLLMMLMMVSSSNNNQRSPDPRGSEIWKDILHYLAILWYIEV